MKKHNEFIKLAKNSSQHFDELVELTKYFGDNDLMEDLIKHFSNKLEKLKEEHILACYNAILELPVYIKILNNRQKMVVKSLYDLRKIIAKKIGEQNTLLSIDRIENVYNIYRDLKNNGICTTDTMQNIKNNLYLTKTQIIKYIEKEKL